MAICKLCSSDTTLIRSHVIPKSLWEIDGAQPPSRLITNTSAIYPKRVPIGVYNDTIVLAGLSRTSRLTKDPFLSGLKGLP